jgi:aminopeptidase N
VDDFIAAFQDATGEDLSQFARWYAQAGTPTVRAKGNYDAASKTYTLSLEQETKPTPGQAAKAPFHIPIRLGLLDAKGADMKVSVNGSAPATSPVLHLKHATQTFEITGVSERPVPSVNRGFSAPVHIEMDLSPAERRFLLARDADPFNRWDAGQQYAAQVLVKMARDSQSGRKPEADPAFVEAFSAMLRDARKDPAYTALMMALPSENELAQIIDGADPEAIHAARTSLIEAIAHQNRPELQDLYAGLKTNEPFAPTAEQAGRRALRNACLRFLTVRDTQDARTLASQHYKAADNMTDQSAALLALVDLDGPEREAALKAYAEQWKDTPLAFDRLFSTQAMSSRPDALARLQDLMRHPHIDIKNPNRVRATLIPFAVNNPLRFHAEDGSGYKFIADQIVALDKINPQMAGRLTGAFETWRRYEPARQAHAKRELARILATPDLSTNTTEIASKTLG